MANNKKVERVFGLERGLGDIIYDKTTKEVYVWFNLGFFGSHKILLVLNQEGTYDLVKTYQKGDEVGTVKLGKTFQATDANNKPVEGITQTTLGLATLYDNINKRNVTGTNDALFITTHKLKERKNINENLVKIGYIKGRYGIEVEAKNTTEEKTVPQTEQKTQNQQPVEQNNPQIEIDEDEIPF